MKIVLADSVVEALRDAPLPVQRAFDKQLRFLAADLHHPSLRAKKYAEAGDRWQARVDKNWRFYFRIADDTYRILRLIPHPKK
jgi:mRNA-degrading endonuclease RelE of RelBE toxin-antitoxin system